MTNDPFSGQPFSFTPQSSFGYNPYPSPTPSAYQPTPGQPYTPDYTLNFGVQSSQGQNPYQGQPTTPIPGYVPIPKVPDTMRGFTNNPDFSSGAAQAQGYGDSNGYESVWPEEATATQQSAQGSVNAQTQANRPNQYSPFSSTQWSQGPDGSWNQSTGFSGPLAGAANSLGTQFANSWAQPMDDGSGARDQAINSAYGQATSRLNPQWAQQGEQMQSQLANQGLDPNSQAYRTASQQFGQQKNDAYSSAMNNAIGQGTAAQQATFNENMQARMAPLQAMQGMYGLANPYGFNSAGNAGGADYMRAYEDQNNVNTQQQQISEQRTADIIGGMTSMGGAMMGGAAKSDERLKTNIQDTGLDGNYGLPLKLFEYKSDPGTPYLGYIAQDVEQVSPQHVGQDASGYKTVSPQFAPQPLSKSQWEFLSPEAKQLLSQTSTSEEKRKAIAHQRELAKAIMAGVGQRHTTGLGAAFGGAGDMIRSLDAGMQERMAREKEEKLTQQQQDAYTQTKEAEATYRKAMIEALRSQNSGGAGASYGGTYGGSYDDPFGIGQLQKPDMLGGM